jgi:GST-like protein
VVYEAGEVLQVAAYRRLQRWTDQIAARPTVKRGRMINRVMGDPASQLWERHDAADFEKTGGEGVTDRPRQAFGCRGI